MAYRVEHAQPIYLQQISAALPAPSAPATTTVHKYLSHGRFGAWHSPHIVDAAVVVNGATNCEMTSLYIILFVKDAKATTVTTRAVAYEWAGQRGRLGGGDINIAIRFTL